jgi:hypothetical protein
MLRSLMKKMERMKVSSSLPLKFCMRKSSKPLALVNLPEK